MTNGLIGWFLAKLYHIPYIFHYIDILHELVPVKAVRGIARVVEIFLLKHSDHIILLNQVHRNYVIHQGVNPRKISIIRTGVALENTTVNKIKFENIKEKYGIDKNDFVIFFMGYLYDFAALLEIIQYYNEKVQNGKLHLKFLILGDGGIYDSVKNLIQKLNANWVILAGRVPYFEIANYIEIANLCLQSFSINNITREISPIKIYEYMAQKKPTLSTKLPGIYYEIRENNGVIFVPTQEDLIPEIEKLIPIKEQLKEIGEKGYHFVYENIRWEEILKTFRKKLIEIIKNYQRKK
jgi:glycosyltransferase involved in cell wall biosynthesis